MLAVAGVADLASVIAGVRGIVTVAAASSVTFEPFGATAFTLAVFAIEPASTSACVDVYVAVQVVEAPGASELTGHEIGDNPTCGSVTTTDASVTLPVFVTTNEYVIGTFAWLTVAGAADFCRSIDAIGGAGGGTHAVSSAVVVCGVAEVIALKSPVPEAPQPTAAVYVANPNVTVSVYVCVAPAAMGVAGGASVNGPAPETEPPAGATPDEAITDQVPPDTCRLGANAGVSLSAP